MLTALIWLFRALGWLAVGAMLVFVVAAAVLAVQHEWRLTQRRREIKRLRTKFVADGHRPPAA